MYQCDTCDRAKSTKTTGNKMEDMKATVPGERFLMDFGFLRAE